MNIKFNSDYDLPLNKPLKFHAMTIIIRSVFEEGVIRAGFLSMLLGILDASLLGNILAGKGAITKRQGWGINRAGEGVIRAGYGTKRQH